MAKTIFKQTPPSKAPAAERRSTISAQFDEEPWLRADEGQLVVDIAESADAYVIATAVAGVSPEDIEVFVHHDMLTIRGMRRCPEEMAHLRHLLQECHWGSFSRSIILPMEIDPDRITATLSSGILTITIPKIEKTKRIPITAV